MKDKETVQLQGISQNNYSRDRIPQSELEGREVGLDYSGEEKPTEENNLSARYRG